MPIFRIREATESAMDQLVTAGRGASPTNVASNVIFASNVMEIAVPATEPS